jgi:hypothetical protein
MPDPSSAIARSLQMWLDEVRFTGKDADQVTELLTVATAEWGQAQGWRVYRKARSVFPLPPPYADRFSQVDVGCARAGEPPVVIEIDRTDRARSVEKLLAEAAAGHVAIWLRWAEGPVAAPAAPVALVTYPVTRHAGAVQGGRRYSSESTGLAVPEHTDTDLSVSEQPGLFG